MSLNNSRTPSFKQPVSLRSPKDSRQGALPLDYPELIQFLIEPFLESKDALKVDCEYGQNNSRVWIRLAIDPEDKGKVYGRGGRNLQAIRTVLEATARIAGQSVYLDIYGGLGHGHEPDTDHDRFEPEGQSGSSRDQPRRPHFPKPAPSLRPR